VDETALLDRNLRGLAATLTLIGRAAGSPVQFDGAAGAIVDAAPDYPWLNAIVCERRAEFGWVLERVLASAALNKLAVWASEPEQVEVAIDAGFTGLLARSPAMGMELDRIGEPDGASEPIGLAEVGAINDAGYGNAEHELETTLALLPLDAIHAHGRRDGSGRVVAAAMVLDVDDDCSVQYVATLPDAQRHGHGALLLRDALAQARLRGCTTTSLQSSEAGVRLYRRLGYRTVGHLQLRRRGT
jgi:ribosomal protein S18 acetylase RimI-like enzyme